MKKILVLVALLLAPMLRSEGLETSARFDSGSTIFERGASTKKSVLRVIGVDAANNTATGMLVQGTISGGTISISSTVGLLGVSLTTRDVLTQTATPLNITTLAGASTNCVVCLSVHGGGSGIGALFHTGTSSPIDVRNFGHPIALSANAQCFGPFVPGMSVSMQGQGSTDDMVTVDIQKVQ